MWRDMWPTDYAISRENLFFRVDNNKGQTGYMLPIGGNMGFDLEQALDLLDSYDQGQKVFYNVAKTELDILHQRYTDISVKDQSSAYDYLYCARAMAALSGRKLHGQRNHCNYFERTWKFHFSEVTNENAHDAKAFFERFAVEKHSDFFTESNHKILEVLDNLDVYRFSSLALYVDGKIIGCTFGTLIGDTLYVSIEQADRDYRGAYPKLASAFVEAHLDAGAKFVNREDDMGDEGLRRSKLAWNPVEILEKFTITVNAG